MRNFIASALVLAAFALPGVANADPVADRAQAIQLCRAEIAAQAGVDVAAARLDQARVRPNLVRVDIDLWRDGQLTNVRCDVARGDGELTVASISPALSTQTAAN